jgi:hypothetical protein
MVSKKSHILTLSAALSILTMSGGVAAVELATRGPTIQAAPAPAHVVAATHATLAAAKLEADGQS